MRYVAMNGVGAPTVMSLQTTQLPVPKDDEVLIRVMAAGVNRPDVAQRQGLYPPPPDASSILGLEVAGEVVLCGASVSDWQVGDRVTALTNGGGYAEYCVAPQTQCLAWPTGYSAIEAAALPETYFTVWANLFQRGLLKAGERALIHGGSSGIGVTALQLGAEFGASLYATAGSDEKCAACVRFGAVAAINYRTHDFAEEITRLTQSEGLDVILDMVGGSYFNRNLRCLARDGRLVQIAFLQGSKVEAVDLSPIMVKRLTVTGSTMRPRTTAQKGVIAAELREQVWPILNQGRCAPVIFKTFELTDVVAAHQLMESSAHIGKIMLEVG
jgi:NADPH2:quinone reductase